MKTTVEIPEALYKRAKIRAVEEGSTLKDILLAALAQHLDRERADPSASNRSPWECRVLLPEYEAAMKSGVYRPSAESRDITSLIAEDRDAR